MSEQNLKDRIYRILTKYGLDTEKAETIAIEIISTLNQDTMSKNELTAFIDGGSRGNPGEGSACCILFKDKNRILDIGKFFKNITNNEAEYNALLLALNEAKKLAADRLTIYTDSELLERQIKGVYSVKSPNLIPLFNRAKELILNFKNFSIIHIPREENSEADRLANRIMDIKKKITKRYEK